jgi:hypothetical protein
VPSTSDRAAQANAPATRMTQDGDASRLSPATAYTDPTATAKSWRHSARALAQPKLTIMREALDVRAQAALRTVRPETGHTASRLVYNL